MSRTLLLLLVMLGGIASRPLVDAKEPPIAFRDVSVGFPPGIQAPTRSQPPAAITKFSCWAPLYCDLEIRDATAAMAEQHAAELLVETVDGDEVRTTIRVPVPLDRVPEAGPIVGFKDLPIKPYVQVAGAGTEITLRLRTRSGDDLAEPYRYRMNSPLPSRTYVVLSLGSLLPGFDLPKDSRDKGDEGFRHGRVETAAITTFEDLPDKWFGYEAADLVVLATGTAPGEFLNRLLNDQAPAADQAKRLALVEWVRRGGRLVISAGVNLPLLSASRAFQDLLPAPLDAERPQVALPRLFFRWRSPGGAPQIANLAAPDAIPVAHLLTNRIADPARRPRVLLENRPADDALLRPLAVQAPFGLGRITFFAWDLDLPPFTEYALRPEFWDWILRECGSGAAAESDAASAPLTLNPDSEDQLATALQAHLDHFDGLTVISFAHVAFFILLYLLLIGPIEYLLLKRVLGRLEFTWLTFPLIVLTVSLLAYLSAVRLKGDAIRINKIDVVDVDLSTHRVYGQTWLTVYSPERADYSVTVRPGPGWSVQEPREAAHPTVIGWSSRPRGARASLLRRGYEYHVSLDGQRYADQLRDVPIPIWSTKSFLATWSADIDPAKPVVETKLEHPAGDPSMVTGTIQSLLPLDALRDVTVIYAGQAYPTALGVLAPGLERRLVLREKPRHDWLAPETERMERLLGLETDRSRLPAPTLGPSERFFPMFSILFHEAAIRKDQGVTLQNASLRRLDQSWRLRGEHREEVIIIGRVEPVRGPAEQALGPPFSPTLLGLSLNPSDADQRSPLMGVGFQQTFVRLFLPVP